MPKLYENKTSSLYNGSINTIIFIAVFVIY